MTSCLLSGTNQFCCGLENILNYSPGGLILLVNPVQRVPNLNLLFQILNFFQMQYLLEFLSIFLTLSHHFGCRIGSGALILFNKCLVLEVQVIASFIIYL